MKERWVTYDNDHALDCPCCGDVIEIKTSLSEEDIKNNIYMDGDSVRCTDKNCELENACISCDTETEPFVSGDW